MIFEKIKNIISVQTGKNESELTMDTNFREDLGADSLDLFQMINEMENEFDVRIESVESIITIGDAVRFVESQKD